MITSLKDRGVAIRDLKPDNIFVVVDLEKGTHTLESADKYSLGLIDFETAVYLKKDEIEQPFLGGTPFYATPSHVFQNDVLCYFFKNISRNYYFQDWYAAIGMIYLVVTGERLFEKTAKQLTEIVIKLQQPSGNKHTLVDNFKKYNGLFWKSATKEFKLKTSANKFKLQSVNIVIDENVKEMFLCELTEEKDSINKVIQDYIDSQTLFKGDKNKNKLIKFTSQTIRTHIKKWEKGVKLSKTSPGAKNQIVKFLLKLEQLKLQSEQYDQKIKQWEQEFLQISAFDLLEFLYTIVYNYMYKKQSVGPFPESS